MHSSTLTTKGQVTIPIDLRHNLGLSPGDTVIFETVDHKIILSKKKDDITQAFGMYCINKNISLSDIRKAIEKGYTEDDSN